MTRTIDQMIASEVLCCMSSLVVALAGQYGDCTPSARSGRDFYQLLEQAAELAAPVDDFEEAAIEAGVRLPHFADGDHGWVSDTAEHWGFKSTAEAARHYCEQNDVESLLREAYEFWAVTDWFADKLEAAGEKVDRDFASLNIWARTTTGQQIAADGVVARIYAQTHTGLEG